MQKKIILSTMLLASTAIYAQPSMSLKDCMRYALDHSSQIQIKRSEGADARVARREAIMIAFTPEVQASVSGYYQFGRSIDPETNVYSNVTSFHNNYGVTASFTLFDGFKTINNMRTTKISIAISRDREEEEEAKVCLATMEAYFNYVYYYRLAEICKDQLATAQSQLRKAERQEELGQKSHADVVQSRADLADRKYDLVHSENLRNDALFTLKSVMMWPEDSILYIKGVMKKEERSKEVSLSGDVVDLGLSLPSLRIAQAEEEKARLDLQKARWQYAPTLSLNGGWNTSYYEYPGQDIKTASFREQFRNNGGEYVQVSISFPIFDRLSRHNDIARKRHAYERATLANEQTRRDVENEMRRARQDSEGAWLEYRQACEKASIQSEAFNLNFRKYEQGLISALEYQTASQNYLKAQADQMQALCTYQLKQAVVYYYNGVNYLEQQWIE